MFSRQRARTSAVRLVWLSWAVASLWAVGCVKPQAEPKSTGESPASSHGEAIEPTPPLRSAKMAQLSGEGAAAEEDAARAVTEALTGDAKGWAHCFRAKLAEEPVTITGAPVGETPSCLVRFAVERDGSPSRAEAVEQIVYHSSPQGQGSYRVKGLSAVARCLIDYVQLQHFAANDGFPAEVQYRFRPEVACPECVE